MKVTKSVKPTYDYKFTDGTGATINVSLIINMQRLDRGALHLATRARRRGVATACDGLIEVRIVSDTGVSK